MGRHVAGRCAAQEYRGGTDPLAGFNVQYLYMTSQDPEQVTYINAIGPHAKLANGKPIYDGHVIKSGGRPARIRRCAAAPGNGDPRTAIKNAGVPVINVMMQGDVLGGLRTARADSERPPTSSAGTEVAGTAHSSPPPYRDRGYLSRPISSRLGPAAVSAHDRDRLSRHTPLRSR